MQYSASADKGVNCVPDGRLTLTFSWPDRGSQEFAIHSGFKPLGKMRQLKSISYGQGFGNAKCDLLSEEMERLSE
jgi:hypothetical protein